MTTRILPPEEWAKLVESGLDVSQLDPEHCIAIVVEDDDVIIGRWLVLRVIHTEGLWVHPAHQKKVSVLRRLLREMRTIVNGFYGANAAWTAAESDDVANLVKSYGGVKLPHADHYIFPVAGV